MLSILCFHNDILPCLNYHYPIRLWNTVSTIIFYLLPVCRRALSPPSPLSHTLCARAYARVERLNKLYICSKTRQWDAHPAKFLCVWPLQKINKSPFAHRAHMQVRKSDFWLWNTSTQQSKSANRSWDMQSNAALLSPLNISVRNVMVAAA